MNLQEFSSVLKSGKYPLKFPGHFVDNQWTPYQDAKPTHPSFNPNNGENITTCFSDKQVLLDALDASDRGQHKLLELSFDVKLETIARMRQLMGDYRDEFVRSLCIQCGKPQSEAEKEFDAGMIFFDHLIKVAPNLEKQMLGPAALDLGEGDYKLLPVGTIVAYLPFSNPVLSFAKYFSAAIVSGCPLILCPSLHANLCGFLFGYLVEHLEMPAGSVSIIFGTFENFQSVIQDKRIQAIIYTGSREHCDLIRRESRSSVGRQLILQSGGKNASLIHSSADLELSVKSVIEGAFTATGQLCTSTSRVFVHKTKLGEFCELLAQRVGELIIERTDKFDTKANRVFMGPLYSKKAVEKFLRYQTMAHREAKKTILWGKAKEVSNADNGFFVNPGLHLMKTFDKSSSYQSNVLFCPDVAIYEYDVLDQAIEMINSTDAPFCVSFIGDEDIIAQRRDQFIAPNLLVNLPTVSIENTPSLSGKYFSGHHRYNGLGLCSLLSYPQMLKTNF